jgi:dihydroflavonol-4-reductase
MKAFVTGGAGFVGAALVRELLADGIEVSALVRPGSDMRNLQNLPVSIYPGDLRDEHSLTTAMNGCQWVFHVAAYYGTSDSDSDAMYAVNVEGTRNVLAAARDAAMTRVVHCSTIGTIGHPADGSLPDETTPFNLWQNASHYARSKYQGECAALEAAGAGLPVIVVNPCAPIGLRDIKPSSSGQRIVDVLNGKLPSYLHGGINHIAVQDVARGHILAAQYGRVGERYILGNRNLMLEDFLRLVEQASGVRAPRPARRWNPLALLRARSASQNTGTRPAALVCDCKKAISELGLPQTPLNVAFSQAVAWFRQNGYAPGGGS